MKIFGLTITRNTPPTQTKSDGALSPFAAAWLRGNDSGCRAPSLRNAYEQVVWVYRAVNAVAEQLANIPFVFSRGERGRENLITSGPLHAFYNRPHPRLNRFQYWELRVLWLLLRGESFRLPTFVPRHPSATPSPRPRRTSADGLPDPSPGLPVKSHIRSSSDRLESVTFLDPARLQHIIIDHDLVGWRYTDSSPNSPIATQVLLPEEIWFERLPNPFDPWRGLAPLLVASQPATTDFTAANFMRGALENNGDLGMIIRSSEQLSEEQRYQVLSSLIDRKRYAGTPDRPLLLADTLEVIRPTLSSADLEFLANRKFSRAEICAAFGVPEEIVATTDQNKYDVMQGARLNFIENRIAPLCARLEAEEQQTVQAIDPSAVGWFDLDSLPILQQARRARLATAKTGFDMGIPFNHLNRVLDLGFPELPWGHSGFLPAALQNVGTADPASPSPRQLPAPNATTGPLPATGTPVSLESLLPLVREFRDRFKELAAAEAQVKKP